MKIQLSPIKIVPDAVVIWNQPGPEVDIVMDLSNITFRPGSINEMYVFHVLEAMFPDEAVKAVKNWKSILAIPGTIHTINDDFEYITRAFVGGDINIEMYNNLHNHANQCTRDSIAKLMKDGGFPDSSTHIWIEGGPEGVPRKHYELIMTSKKNAND